ncbi:MAG: hypothetical protein C5B49_12000, partial [Bdellovibrio sp.]
MARIIETSLYFFRLGLTGFGGPIALVGQMHVDLVDRRHWIEIHEFRQAFATIKAMPGPVAHQMAIYIARKRAGFWGGLLSGLFLIIPSFVMMLGLAMAYDQFVEFPAITEFLYGLQVSALALIFYSLRSLTHSYWSLGEFWVLFIIGLALIAFGWMPEFLLIPILGIWAVIIDGSKRRRGPLALMVLPSFVFDYSVDGWMLAAGVS